MGIGSVLAGAGRIGRQYEQDVSYGMGDATRLLANQAQIRALSEQDRMEQMRQGMANAPRFDYGAATTAPAVTLTQGSMSAAQPAAATPQPSAPAAPRPIMPGAPAMSAAPAADPWIAKNRAEEADRAERGALASRFGPFGGLVKWFGDIKAEEEAKRQAYISEATGRPEGATQGLGTRNVTGQIGSAATGRPQAPQQMFQQQAAPTQQAVPPPQAAARQAAPAPQAAGGPAQQSGGYVSTTYNTSNPQVAQQARMIDMQAQQLAGAIDSWQRAGAPQGGAAMVMQAQGKLMELALTRVNLEMQNAVSFFERGGDPSTMIALLNHTTGQQFTLYQHPQNPQMVSIGPPGARPETLSWASPAQLAHSVRMLSDQQFRNQVYQLQSKIAEKQAEQQGQMAVEGVKGQYGIAKEIAGKQMEANKPTVNVMNTPGGGQGALVMQGGRGAFFNPSPTPMKVGGEMLPTRPRFEPVQGVPQPQQQSQPQQPANRLIVPGYQ